MDTDKPAELQEEVTTEQTAPPIIPEPPIEDTVSEPVAELPPSLNPEPVVENPVEPEPAPSELEPPQSPVPNPQSFTPPTPEPPVEHSAEVKPDPEPTEVAPKEPALPIPSPEKQPPPALEPQVSNIKPTLSDDEVVASLTDAQLKVAAALYTKRNQAEISRKGVAKRKETMELNLREIVDFLSLNNGAPLPRIAKNTNITLGTSSKYLRQLIASGKVRADGWGKTRRYYLK